MYWLSVTLTRNQELAMPSSNARLALPSCTGAAAAGDAGSSFACGRER